MTEGVEGGLRTPGLGSGCAAPAVLARRSAAFALRGYGVPWGAGIRDRVSRERLSVSVKLGQPVHFFTSPALQRNTSATPASSWHNWLYSRVEPVVSTGSSYLPRARRMLRDIHQSATPTRIPLTEPLPQRLPPAGAGGSRLRASRLRRAMGVRV